MVDGHTHLLYGDRVAKPAMQSQSPAHDEAAAALETGVKAEAARAPPAVFFLSRSRESLPIHPRIGSNRPVHRVRSASVEGPAARPARHCGMSRRARRGVGWG